MFRSSAVIAQRQIFRFETLGAAKSLRQLKLRMQHCQQARVVPEIVVVGGGRDPRNVVELNLRVLHPEQSCFRLIRRPGRAVERTDALNLVVIRRVVPAR